MLVFGYLPTISNSAEYSAMLTLVSHILKFNGIRGSGYIDMKHIYKESYFSRYVLIL